MLLSGSDAHGQHVPAQRVLHAGLDVIHKDARVDAAEAALTFEQEGEVLAIWLRLDLEKASQTLLVEEPRRERVGRRKAPDRISGVLWRPPEIEHRAAGLPLALPHDRSQ